MAFDPMRLGPRLETERLILRPLADSDFEPYAAMMSDEENTRYIGGPQVEAMAWRGMMTLIGHWMVRGYGFFALEEKSTGRWVGRVGPWYPHGWPQPEIGWTVVRECWGRGYASEAAACAMDWAIDHLGWKEVIHLIHPDNHGSIAVAKKIGSRNLGRTAEIPGFGMIVDVWGQSAEEWRGRRG